MAEKKTKSIKRIEEKMEGIDPGSLRYRALDNAKGFKTSWMELGQILDTVWRDKMYKEWGYTEFEGYASKEIGIRKQTAMKLVRSYTFLQKAEPDYLKKEYTDNIKPAQVPTYEAVDVLRRADSSKDIDREDYAKIKKYVLKDGKDARDVQKDLTQMIKKKEELDPQDAYEKKSRAKIKRFLSTLKSIKKEANATKALPKAIVDQTNKLICMIEDQMHLSESG